jgi:hypothetical protein
MSENQLLNGYANGITPNSLLTEPLYRIAITNQAKEMEKQIENVFVEIDGNLIPIRELSKSQYETFLEIIHRIRLAYITTIDKPTNQT